MPVLRALPLVAGLWLAPLAGAAVLTLTPSKDNTLIQVEDGRLSNALGSLFTGMVANGTSRRPVMAFPIQQIPAGSVITRVDLTVSVTKTTAGAYPFVLHRVTQDWGEGTSNGGGRGLGADSSVNDATWFHTFFAAQFWNTPGGDYDAAVSAQTVLDQVGSYTFASTPQLVADVQRWLDNPPQNFGWLMKAAEEETWHTAKRLGSRESSTSFRPTLRIEYVPAPGAAVLLGLGLLAARRRRV